MWVNLTFSEAGFSGESLFAASSSDSLFLRAATSSIPEHSG